MDNDKYFQDLKDAVADLNLDIAEEERRLNELNKAQHVTLYDYSPKKAFVDDKTLIHPAFDYDPSKEVNVWSTKLYPYSSEPQKNITDADVAEFERNEK
jgi:hypothetical protein